MAPAFVQVDPAKLAGRRLGCLSEKHLAPRGESRNARGDIHSRAEPVPVTLERRTRVHANADRRESVLLADVLDDAQPQPNRSCRVASTDHHSVTDRLDL